MRIPVCFSSDNNYAPHLGVAITSILKNKGKEDNLVFYILNGGISEKNKKKLISLKTIFDLEIQFIDVDRHTFKDFPLKIRRNDHLTLAAYYRLIIPDIFKNEDKIVYLDCDLIVKTSLKELFEINLNEYYLGAIIDINYIQNAKRLGLNNMYYNSGVLLINVLAWRRDNVTTKLFEWTKNNRQKILYYDQDILNVVLEHNIKRIDDKWNIQVNKPNWESDVKLSNFAAESCIIHYISVKPWDAACGYILFEELYHKYRLFTPWKRAEYYFKVKRIFRNFIKWLFTIHNINHDYKVFQIFGKPIIKVRRKKVV